jgi:hypothetical protein
MGYSFLLFAIILTGGYVAYYTYMILRDLNANKGDANKNVETFEVKPEKQSPDSESDTNIETTCVSETADGFAVGNRNVDVRKSAKQAEQVEEPKPSAAETKISNATRNMTETDVASTGGMDDEMFMQYIMNNPHDIFKPTVDPTKY